MQHFQCNRFSSEKSLFIAISIFRLLNYACASQATLPTAEVLLNNEISWLKKVKVSKYDLLIKNIARVACINVFFGESGICCLYMLLYLLFFFGSFGNEPMQSCSVHRVSLSSVLASVYSPPSGQV